MGYLVGVKPPYGLALFDYHIVGGEEVMPSVCLFRGLYDMEAVFRD